MALALNLVPAEHSGEVLLKLVEDIRQREFQQTSGDIGHRYLLEALMRHGQSEVIATMTRRETLGSYGGIIRQDWTSMPEAWDINLNSSLNHCMLGHIQQWFWEALVGIRPDISSPGFKSIIIEPNVNNTVEAANGTYNSIYGEIACEWKRQDEHLEMTVTIPANTTARIYLPTVYHERVRESKTALLKTKLPISLENGKLVVLVGSGKYFFVIELNS
jgi:hypothetical protein